MLADRYRLEHLLGAGGMGTVHAAFDTRLERRVAIKMLPSETEADAHVRARFRREALAAAALDHPYICKIYEVGEHDGHSFIVMEHVDGQTLDVAIAGRTLTPRQVLDAAHELAQALEQAHLRGIVHRDLKPSNIMLTSHGHVKVLDFGLAKAMETAGAGVTTAATAAGVTMPGTRLGTPAYMSPEQVLGNPLDARSDIFSLGVVLHELSCGRHPFRQELPGDTMAAILRDPPASTPADLDVVPGFGAIVHRMLAKACAERFQTMRELANHLDALRERGTSGTPGSGAAAGQGVGAERTAFVARDSELAELVGHLDRMLLGHGAIVLLGGEPGVGKTRLARELQRIARARGCVIVTGQCYEQEGAPPFCPFVESMEHLLRSVPHAVRAALGDVAPEMSLIVPEIRRVFPDIPPAPALPVEQQRRVLFNAYLAYVQRATAKSAAVLLLDDLHWADDASVQLLLHVASHVPALRLLLVGTYRDVDLEVRRPFAKALETLLRQRLAVRTTVRRLPLVGVKHLLETMSGSVPPDSLVSAVHEHTEGNPFFVEEVFQHLKEEGRLFDEAGEWLPTLHAGDIDVPEGVRLVISRRLEQLGEDTRRVLTAAAVIGRSFPLDLLDAVAGGTGDALLDAVEQAERAQLLHAERQGREARYTFVHELIRSTLLGELSLPRRQRLHVRVADALENRRARAGGHVTMLAHHLYEAGAAVDEDRAVAAIAAAMQEARSAGAFEQALTFADQLMSFDPPAGSEIRLVVEQVRLAARYALGRLDQAMDSAEQLLALALPRGDHARIADACYSMSKAAIWAGAPERGLALQLSGLAALPVEAPAARAEALAGYSNLLLNTGQGDLAAGPVAEAVELARRCGRTDVLGVALGSLGVLESWQGHATVAQELLEEAIALLAPTWHPVTGMAVLMKLLLLVLRGRVGDLDRFLPEAERLSIRSGHPVARWFVDWARTSASVYHTGDAAPWLGLAGTDHGMSLRGVARVTLNEGMTQAWLCAGAAGKAEQVLADSVVHHTIDPSVVPATLMLVHAWAGNDEGVRTNWREIRDAVTSARPGSRAWRGLYALAPSVLALSLIGEDAVIGPLYPSLVECIAGGMTSVTVGPGSFQLAAAAAASAAGMADQARVHFERALAEAHAMPMRQLQPVVRMWFGRFLVAHAAADDRPRGLALLQDAAADFGALGMPLHRTRAAEWLAAATR